MQMRTFNWLLSKSSDESDNQETTLDPEYDLISRMDPDFFRNSFMHLASIELGKFFFF